MPRLTGGEILRRYWRSISLLIALLIALELILRVLFPQPVHTYFYGLAGEKWIDDPELFWIPPDRHEHPISLAKATNPERLIYAFGGSILTNHLAGTNFLTELQKCLGRDYAVANFATGGYSSYQSLALFQRMLAKKTPRIVIASHGYNDRSLGIDADTAMAKRNQRAAVRLLFLLSHAKIVQVWRRLMWKVMGYDPYKVNPSSPGLKNRVSFAEYSKNLEKYVHLCKKHGSYLVFVSQAFPDQAVLDSTDPYFVKMKEIAGQHDHVYFLDIRPTIIRQYQQHGGGLSANWYGEKSLLFNDQCHYNDRGHRLVGKLLCDFLGENNLVESPNRGGVK